MLPSRFTVTVVHHGADQTFGTVDDEAHATTTGADGIWTVGSLPGGRVTVLVDPADLPAGMTSTADSDHELVHPNAVWSGWLRQDEDREGN